jgi:hypothetical protein
MSECRGRRFRRLTALLVLTGTVAFAAVPAAAVARTHADSTVVVLLGNTVIEPRSALSYDCHDRDYPIIRCFRSPMERAQEQAAVASMSVPSDYSTAEALALLSPYVRWYRDAGFSGPSFEAYDPYRDLGPIGWDNQISSFIPLNGGHPVWWTGSNFTSTRWDWGTGSVANLGLANDQFSSVSKV